MNESSYETKNENLEFVSYQYQDLIIFSMLDKKKQAMIKTEK